MRVREFVQTILLEAPSLDAEIYIGADIGGFSLPGYDYKTYKIKNIEAWNEKELNINLEEDES